MTSVTGTTLITDALLDLGVLAAGQTPGSEDLSLGLRRLNAMLSTWRTDGLTVPIVTRTAYNLVANTATYTIGSGGVFNQDRPEHLLAAGLIRDPSATSPQETPLGGSLTRAEWMGTLDKAVTGVPERVYYEPLYTASLGRVNVYPVPDASTYDLVLYTPTPLAALADTSTTYVFPSGYEEAVVAALAVRLAPAFGAVPSGDLVRRATDSLKKIKYAHAEVPILGMDPSMPGLHGRTFDIYAGR